MVSSFIPEDEVLLLYAFFFFFFSVLVDNILWLKKKKENVGWSLSLIKRLEFKIDKNYHTFCLSENASDFD